MLLVYQVTRWLRYSSGLWFGMEPVTSSCKSNMSFTLEQPVPQNVAAALDSASLPFETTKLFAVSHSPKSLAEATASDAAKALKSYWLLSPAQADTACSAA